MSTQFVCWICGDPANSGEHLIKQSDIRSALGAVSAAHPLFMHTAAARNIPVRGLKSKLLHSDAPMCAKCNNERTQPYDIAWQHLSDHLGRQRQPLQANQIIRLIDLFEGKVRQSLLDIHLYFVKAFGCKVMEAAAVIDLDPFRTAILKRHPHPNVHVAICPAFNDDVRVLTNSQIYALDGEQTGRTVYATWLYALNYVSVRVVYAEPKWEDREGMRGTWHPSTATSKLRIADNFGEEETPAAPST